MQGKSPKRSRDDQQPEDRPLELPWAVPKAGQLDMVDSWDDMGPFPRAKDVAAAAALAPSSPLAIARRALPIVVVVMGTAIIALAMTSFPSTWRRDFGEDTPSILLLVFAGIAVLSWSCVVQPSAVRRQAQWTLPSDVGCGF